MIATPMNDQECLGKLTEVAAQATQRADVRQLATAFPTTGAAAAWIRTLPQRNDDGNEKDGPRVTCDVSQRARVVADDPNCVERSLLYVALAELIDPRPVRQLATIDTTMGRHTFPVENGKPVVLDPKVPRNALSAGLYQLRNGGPADGTALAGNPAELFHWIAEIAEEPAAEADGQPGLLQVRHARRVFAQILAGEPATQDDLTDAFYAVEAAARVAPMFGPAGIQGVELAWNTLSRLWMSAASPRNGCGCARNAGPNRGRLVYWSGKSVATATGWGTLYDPAYNAAAKRPSPKRAPGRGPDRGTGELEPMPSPTPAEVQAFGSLDTLTTKG